MYGEIYKEIKVQYILIVNKGTNFKSLKFNDSYIHYLQKRIFKVLVYEQNLTYLVSYPGFDVPVTCVTHR